MQAKFEERIMATLRECPNGLTSKEVAERLGTKAGNISSRLSKLAAYGIISKAQNACGSRGNVYRALTHE